MRRLARRLLLAAPLLLAACASPSPALYTLQPVNGSAAGGAPAVIQLRQVGIAQYLDRNTIVRSIDAYRVAVYDNDWWSEPLGGMIGRVLAAGLSQRLPGSTVTLENAAVSLPPEIAVQVQISRFDVDPAGALVLEAQVALIPQPGARAGARGARTPAGPLARSLRFQEPAGKGAADQVAAGSRALGQLADAIAGMLRR